VSWAPHYFQFTNEAQATAALRAASLYKGPQDDRNPNLDVIADEWNRDGVYDSNGNVITPPTKRPGYYVNLMWDGALPPNLVQFEVFPSDPYQIFAGWGPGEDGTVTPAVTTYPEVTP